MAHSRASQVGARGCGGEDLNKAGAGALGASALARLGHERRGSSEGRRRRGRLEEWRKSRVPPGPLLRRTYVLKCCVPETKARRSVGSRSHLACGDGGCMQRTRGRGRATAPAHRGAWRPCLRERAMCREQCCAARRLGAALNNEQLAIQTHQIADTRLPAPGASTLRRRSKRPAGRPGRSAPLPRSGARA